MAETPPDDNPPPPGLEDVRDALDAAEEWAAPAAAAAEAKVTNIAEARAAKEKKARKSKGGDGADVSGKEKLAAENAIKVSKLNEQYAVVLVGDKCVILKEGQDEHGRHRVNFMAVGAFGQWLANETVFTGTDVVPLSDFWMSSKDRRQYEGVVFKPDGAPDRYYNLWRGFAVEPAARLPDPKDHIKHFQTLYDHVRVNIAQEDEGLARWVWAWCAHIIQRPTERIGISLVLRGRQGTGKSTLGEVMGHLLNPHYSQVDDPRYLTGNFNSHMASCLLLQAEEAFWAGDKKIEGMLKGLITSSTHYIERKGYEPVKVDNYIRLMFTSNNDWVVPAGLEERRFATLDVGDSAIQNAEYFETLWRELNEGGFQHLMRYLLDFDLGCVNLRKIPKTKALLDQKRSSAESPLQWWWERLEAGQTRRASDGWETLVPADDLISDYIQWCERMRWGAKPAPAVGRMLASVLPKAPPGGKAPFRKERQRRPQLDGDFGKGTHHNVYIIPPLDQCRAALEEAIGQPIEWPQVVEDGYA